MLQHKPTQKQKPLMRMRKGLMGLLTFATVFSAFAPSLAQASNNYYLNFTFNTHQRTIVPTTLLSEVNNGVDNHAEVEGGGKSGTHYLVDSNKNLLFRMNDGQGASLTQMVPNFKDLKPFYSISKQSLSKEHEYTLPYSFPGRHIGTGAGSAVANDGEYARDATAADQAQANWVGNQLTSGFNRLLGVAHNARYGEGQVKLANLVNTARWLGKISAAGTASHTFENEKFPERAVTISMSPVTSVPNKDPHIDLEFYRKITVKGKEGSGISETYIMPVEINKGYTRNTGRMYDIIKNTKYADKKKGYLEQDVYSISWNQMVLQATHHASNGIMIGDAHQLRKPGRVEGAFVVLLDSVSGGIKNALGLDSITDLVFNKGAHGDSSVRGTMPQALASVADYVYFLVLILAVVILLGSFVSILIKSNLSVINPQMRVDMKDGLMTIIGAFFILVIFQPIWSSLLVLNESLVDYFYAITPNSGTFGSDLLAGTGSIANFVLAIALLVVEVWFNFFYIVRALTIMVLYMFAPLMIVSIAYGGKFKMIFSNWSKEILGALFTQSIHAAILGAITAGLNRGLGTSWLWQYVVLISIIPITNMFRKNILALGGDSIGTTAERGEKGALMAGAIGTGLLVKGAATVGAKGLSNAAATGSIFRGAPSAAGGGGGGGSRSGGAPKVALSDAKDGAIAGTHTAQEDLKPSKMSAMKESMSNQAGALKDSVAARIPEPVAQLGKGAMNGLRSGTQKTAQALNSKPVRAAGAATGAIMGAALTAGAAIGDVATDGGSSSALITASHIMGGRGNGKSKGGGGGGGDAGFRGGAYSTPDEILAMKPPIQSLNKLEQMAEKDGTNRQGNLALQTAPDGSQIITKSKEQLAEKANIHNLRAIGPDNEHRQGITRMDVPSEGLSAESERMLEYGYDLSRRRNGGEILPPREEEAYKNMREQAGISNVSYNHDTKAYVVDIDNQQQGWYGTAGDDKHFMIRANETASKQLPEFHTHNAQSTLRVENWYKQASGIHPQSGRAIV